MNDEREAALFRSLIYLADTIVTGFDVIDLADRLVSTCDELLGAAAAGILLDDQRGGLRVLASSSEELRILELLELQANEGPCLEAFETGELVAAVDLSAHKRRWPGYVRHALRLGFVSAYAIPMRLRERTIGALNIFQASPEPMSTTDLQVAQVLTSMATIGLINHQALRRQELLAEQLQTALNSRIAIEQAKGVIAERAGVDMNAAFDLLRSAARSSRRPLSELAADVAAGRMPDGHFGIASPGPDQARRSKTH